MTPDPQVALPDQPGVQPVAAVTGATGFLGRFVVAELLKAGWKTRLLVRRDPIHPQLPQLDTEVVFGDLSDQNALERLCAGTDAVIHIAGLVKARDRASFFHTNVDGSAALATAASRVAPAARIIGLSSLAAREPALSDYAASKNAAETALFENSKGPVTILRPSAIYGRWDRETFPLFRMAARGIALAPTSPDARICLIHVSDVARAVVAFAGAGPQGATYELSDETVAGYCWSEIVKTAGDVVNKSPRILAVPAGFLRAFGLLSEKSAHFLGTTPILTRGKIREMLHEDWASTASQQPPADIWKPQVNLINGFRDTAEWYRYNAWM